VAGIVLWGCGDRSPTDPGDLPPELLASYVALGNSITAGFQSGGINRDTQRESYAVLLAEAMGVEFHVPELELPGCPPPLVDALTGERLGGSGAPLCSFRRTPLPPVVHNVAVPGARVGDVLAADGGASGPNPLQLLLLGGLTQMEAARAADPTFVTVWIGNNDVLAAALSGAAGPGNVTSPEDFRASYRAILDALEDAGVLGGVLVGVAEVTRVPFLSPGHEYWEAAGDGRLPEHFRAEPSCAPGGEAGTGEETLVPFDVGVGALGPVPWEDSSGDQVVLDCAAGDRVLQPEEIAFLEETVRSYNDFIEAEAAERGWAFHDPNPTLRALAEEGAVPAFPLLDHPDELFGSYFSLDGVHPSGEAHRLVAAELAAAVNAHYGTALPSVAAARRAAPFRAPAAPRSGGRSGVRSSGPGTRP
jgi:hypothetical protein